MAAEIETALKDGGAFDQIAAGKGLEVKTAQGVKRASTDTPLPQAAVSGAFTGPVGVSGAATGPDGTRYVYVVTDTSVPAFFREAGEIAALDQRLAQALQTSVIGQYVQEREKRLGVSFNQANINRVIGQGG
jgi:peptidyl-prolyl cis-trans isomerase D